ncbi:MAG TPA: 3-hydroxyacyl-CoA dehydrogenase NAD-binding domain-containing protein [Thermoplasmataceae archaeon]|nr:3-hydroxyacyl-CoA dehydrogenase NAD-binding domain-containing protein [Thermoplasmataceae archaeon]
MKVTVIGAGTMGNGIAQVFAQGGNEVVLTDIIEPVMEKARDTIANSLERLSKKGLISETPDQVKRRITFTKSIDDGAGSDIYVEAIVEKVELKKDILQKINEMANEDSIIATNTSSISINYLSGFVKHPENFLGMHFFNPPPVMKLIEIVTGVRTSKKAVEKIQEISKDLGKEPVVVKDYPGFVANRVLMPLLREAIVAYEEGVASKEDIDKTVRLGLNHPMGPLELADFVGLDVTYDVMKVLYDEFGDPRYKPPITLRNMVNAGLLGRKTGEGFYKY